MTAWKIETCSRLLNNLSIDWKLAVVFDGHFSWSIGMQQSSVHTEGERKFILVSDRLVGEVDYVAVRLRYPELIQTV